MGGEKCDLDVICIGEGALLCLRYCDSVAF